VGEVRVLYLNPFSQEISGPDESLLTVLGELVARGVKPQVVLPAPGPQVERYRRLGARVHFVPMSILKRRLAPTELALFPAHLAASTRAIAKLARSERIDLVHTNMEVVLEGALATRLTRIPHVLHYRGNVLDRPRPVFDVLTRFWVGTSEQVFCISEGTAAIFRKRGLAATVAVLYNAVDLGRYASAGRSARVRRDLGAQNGELLVGNAGRLHPRKDLETFLRAAALVAARAGQARFVLVGGAEVAEERAYEARLRLLARELGIEARVAFAGARRDMPEVMASLDVLVLSSRFEGFGRVVAEGMAAAVPVVATAEGGPGELIEHGVQGLLAAPGNDQEFANHIERLVRDPGLRQAMGQAGRKRASLFLPSRAADTLFTSYCRLIGLDQTSPGISSGGS